MFKGKLTGLFSIFILVIVYMLFSNFSLGLQETYYLNNLTMESLTHRQIDLDKIPFFTVGDDLHDMVMIHDDKLKHEPYAKLYVTREINGNDTISVVDALTTKVIKSIPIGQYPMDMLSYAHFIYIANSESDTVSVIDTDTDQI